MMRTFYYKKKIKEDYYNTLCIYRENEVHYIDCEYKSLIDEFAMSMLEIFKNRYSCNNISRVSNVGYYVIVPKE